MGIAEASRASAVWARISPKVSPMPGPSTCGIVRSTIQTVVCRTPSAWRLGITHRWFGGKPPAWAAVFKVHCSCANTARKETKGGYFRDKKVEEEIAAKKIPEEETVAKTKAEEEVLANKD